MNINENGNAIIKVTEETTIVLFQAYEEPPLKKTEFNAIMNEFKDVKSEIKEMKSDIKRNHNLIKKNHPQDFK